MKKNIILALLFILCGFAGMGAFTLAHTMYQDHKILWEVVRALNQNAQQSQQAAPK
jgi:hypothetical protein